MKRSLSMVPLVAILACGAGTVALAQANTIFISQIGGNNSALIEQKGITGSDIGTAVDPVVQTGTGNDLNIAISADGADIDEAIQDNTLDALLRGNQASITIGDQSPGAVVTLEQAGGGGNIANITVNGGAFGAVSQTGSANEANLSVTGNAARGTITQANTTNIADLSVTGDGSSGTIDQVTSGNIAALRIEGNGLDVTYRQSGLDNLRSASYDPTGDGGTIQMPEGITVFSVGAPVMVTIEQTTN